jgi:hypothetical protein
MAQTNQLVLEFSWEATGLGLLRGLGALQEIHIRRESAQQIHQIMTPVVADNALKRKVWINEP